MNKIYKVISYIFIIFWIFFLFTDYLQKHPRLEVSFEVFRYSGLYFLYFIFFAIMAFLVYQKKWLSKVNPFINWLLIFGLTFIIASANINSFVFQWSKYATVEDLSISNYIIFAKNYFLLGLSTLLIFSSCFSIGNLINRIFKVKFQPMASELIDIGMGILTITLIIFFLGVLNVLNAYFLWPVVILFIAINYKSWFHFMKNLLFKPIKIPANINVLGVFSFLILLIIFAINFQQILRPIPTGFDAIMLYVNLPALLADHQSLVAGFQPYNWSLFMSIGFVMFAKTEVALALSSTGGLLSLFLMYYLGKNWFKININILFLALAVFYLSPTIVHQSSKEIKVDLGLLFFCFSCIILFVYWYKKEKDGDENNSLSQINDASQNENESFKHAPVTSYSALNFKDNDPLSFPFLNRLVNNKLTERLTNNINPYLILLGLFSGFALAIKLTSAFIILSITAAIWYVSKSRLGFLSMFFICMFLVLFLRFDQTGDLRQYHLSANYVMFGSLGLGLGLLVYQFIKDRKEVVKFMKTSIIYALITILPFLPWAAKNIIETGSFSVSAILVGKKLGPDMSAPVIIKNFQDYNKR